jgi:hypothetical protein
MDASEIIAAFGGPAKVAEMFGCSRTAVCNWRRDGIPARLWFSFIDKARDLGIEGVTQDTVSWRPKQRVAA